MAWIFLSYRLPTEHSRSRVQVWREVRRTGALQLQQSLVAFPDTETLRPAVERLQKVIEEVGGEALVVRADPLEKAQESRLRALWSDAIDAAYGELVSECTKFLSEIDHEFEIEKFTNAELEEEESEHEKLRAWHERIRARDVHRATRAEEAAKAMGQAEEAISRYATAVFERTQR